MDRTGSIKLSTFEVVNASGTISLITSEIEEFYNHNHGTGGKFVSDGESGGSKKDSNPPVEEQLLLDSLNKHLKGVKNPTEADILDALNKGPNGADKISTDEFQTKRNLINTKVEGSKDKDVLDKGEKDLEGLRHNLEEDYNKALESGDHSKARELAKEHGKTDKDLHDLRSKLYSSNDLERIEYAEQVSTNMRQNLLNYSRAGNTPTGVEKGILEDSGAYWEKEVIRAKKEARGEKVQSLNQKVGTINGKALKKDEWPDTTGLENAAESTRPIKTIDEAGFGRKVVIDGIRVKRASEITAKDGTKLRMYDMAGGGKGKKTEEMFNALAQMHELYPMQPPRKLVLVSNLQTQLMAGPRTHAFVFPGSDYIFMNKKAVSHMGKGTGSSWFMPNAKSVPGTQYTFTHEYGHQYDAQNDRSSGRAMFENTNVKQHLSNYGKHNAHEGYAEAFAEWHTSHGQTKNPAAIAYARHEKWHGYDVKVVKEKVAASAYVFLQQEELWDAWAVAEELGIISLANKGDTVNDDNSDVKDFPQNIPIIIENWDTGKPETHNMPSVGDATEEEKAKAEDVIRSVWEELGLDYE